MINLILLIFKPNKFFTTTKTKNLTFLNVSVWGFSFAILSQLIYFILNYSKQYKNFIIESIIGENTFIESSNEILNKLLFLILIFYLFIVPVITIVLRYTIGWVVVKIENVKHLKSKDIYIIICFSMIANFLIIIPTFGIILSVIYLFVLHYIGIKKIAGISNMKCIIFALLTCLITIQPYIYY